LGRRESKETATAIGEAPFMPFRLALGLQVLVGAVGGLMFLPMALVWPIDLVRNPFTTDGIEVLSIVTAIGWAGLGLTIRLMRRPRLVLNEGELVRNGWLRSERMPLSAVKSIDRKRGRSHQRYTDELSLFRGHPEQPWVIELLGLAEPETFVHAVAKACGVRHRSFSPKDAPPD
jgi:hypothetical protein